MSAERRGGAKAQLAGVGPRETVKNVGPSVGAERGRGAKAQLNHRHGWEGWDDYAPFYDWENTHTLGRRDVPFWLRLAKRIGGRALELGCGTGRIAVPLARAGHHVTGIDRSAPMLERAARRAKSLGRAKSRSRSRLALVRGDIRALPFAVDAFSMVLAPYGMLQSLVRDRDLTATFAAVARVLAPGGIFGIDLVPDVPRWPEYRNRTQLRGRTRAGATITLVESVRQDRRRCLTTFEQQFVERRGPRVDTRRFELVFRTLPVRAVTRRLERAGFEVEAILGDYRGRPWDTRSDVWIILARRSGL